MAFSKCCWINEGKKYAWGIEIFAIYANAITKKKYCIRLAWSDSPHKKLAFEMDLFLYDGNDGCGCCSHCCFYCC